MKYIQTILLVAFLFVLMPFGKDVKADSSYEVNIHFFHKWSCPHCAKERELLEKLEDKYPNIRIHMYEVEVDSNKTANIELMEQVKNAFDVVTGNRYDLGATPYTVIGTKEYLGFNDNVAKKIEEAIIYYSNKQERNVVSEIKDGSFYENQSDLVIDEDTGSKFVLPFLGEVDVKTISLPIIAAVIGTVDGFNPCAMWVLLFIITMLINSKDRKRMWIIGFTFLFASAAVYLLFMSAWLQITLSVSSIKWVQVAIGVLAIGGAYFNLNSYRKSLKKDDGCEIVDNTKRKKLVEKIKKFTSEKSLLLALVGVITLAVSVNLVELACSAGLPLMFTQILALNDLSMAEYWSYMLLYIFFFLIDDLIVFTIAMVTFRLTGMSTKYSKWSHLIGGIIMLLMGLLLIFKPEFIMLNF